MELVLVFNGDKRPLKDLPESLSISHLRKSVADATGLSPHLVRVVHRGRQIVSPRTAPTSADPGDDESQLLTVRSGDVVLVSGATEKDVDRVRRSRPDPLVRPFEGTRRTSKYLARPASTRATSGSLSSPTYGFGYVQELQQFDDSDRARELLEQLANDDGVAKVMVKNGFRVGALMEMYPEGKVGVDPVCVLGFNKNKGMEIHIRLRTDDLAGFRPYFKLREVLFHELAHNIHSEHNADFYALMKQLEDEANELDWTARRGRTLGSSTAPSSSTSYQVVEEDRPVLFWKESERLGGTLTPSAADSAASAALARSAKSTTTRTVAAAASTQEHRTRTFSGSNRDTDPTDPSTETNCGHRNHEAKPGPTSSDARSLLPTQAAGRAAQSKSQSSVPQERVRTAAGQTAIALLKENRNPEDIQPKTDSEMGDQTTELQEQDHGDEDGDGDPATSRVKKTRRLVGELRQDRGSTTETATDTIRTLLLYLNNARANPDVDRYRSINRDNPSFQRRVGRFPSAVAILCTFGFSETADNRLVLRSSDPGLLWLGTSVLEEYLQEWS